MTAVDADFATLADPYRRELLAHCYRMLGSVHDADDLVQETYLRAWRGYDRFEGRSSLRNWLYAIATRVCLTAIESRGRRPLPSGLAAPTLDHRMPVTRPETAVPWLEPVPDALVVADTGDPAAVVEARAGVRLAFVAALQHLPARQRAVLLLRDVLAWRAAEVADVLDMTTVGVNSALQRAHARMAGVAPGEHDLTEPVERELRQLLDRYVDAFVRSDMSGLVDVLLADVELEMPPIETWFRGAATVATFLSLRAAGEYGTWRAVATRANGQPAAAFYQRGDDGLFHAHGINLVEVATGRISRITAFLDPGLFAVFGLEEVLALTPCG